MWRRKLRSASARARCGLCFPTPSGHAWKSTTPQQFRPTSVSRPLLAAPIDFSPSRSCLCGRPFDALGPCVRREAGAMRKDLSFLVELNGHRLGVVGDASPRWAVCHRRQSGGGEARRSSGEADYAAKLPRCLTTVVPRTFCFGLIVRGNSRCPPSLSSSQSRIRAEAVWSTQIGHCVRLCGTRFSTVFA